MMKQRPGDKKIFPRLAELVQELLSPDMISGCYDLFPTSQGHHKNRGFTTTNLLFFLTSIVSHTWEIWRNVLFLNWKTQLWSKWNGINYLFHNYPSKEELGLILITDVSSSFIINQIDCQSAFWKTFSLPPPPATENKLLLWVLR